MHVEDFAIRGVAAVEIVAVPGGHADRAVVRILFGDINPARYRIRLADPVHAAAFRHRLTRFYDARAGRNAVARINPAGHLAIGAIGERKAAQTENKKACALANMVVSPEAIHPAYDPRSEAARIPHRAAGGNLRYARW